MFLETLRQALSAILRNAMRSFLTVLGVIIGVAAVIAMVTIGQGSTAQIESDVSSLGVNLLMMRPGQGMGPASSSRTAPLFSLKDVEAIKEQVPGVLAVAPVNSSTQTVIAGNENHSATITGTDGEYLTVRSWKIVDGRGFLDAEARAHDRRRSPCHACGPRLAGQCARVGKRYPPRHAARSWRGTDRS